jgi:hypothetical protein
MKSFYLPIKVVSTTLILLFYFTSNLFSQGETCGTAVEVTPGTYTADGPATGNGAVNECTFPIAGTGTHADWYYFDAPVNGTMSISSCESSVDTRLSILTGSFCGFFGGFNCFASDDDGCPSGGTGSTFASDLQDLDVNGGTRYYIHWDNRWSTIGFDWTLEFSPDNDDCLGAIELTCGDTLSGSTVGADGGFFDPECTGGSNNDVFYSFNAVAGNTYTISVNGDNYDAVLAIYAPFCFFLPDDEPVSLDCSDSGIGSGIAESITYTPDESGEIIIQTYDWFTNGGEFEISVDCSIANDQPCSAIDIACGDTLSNTTVGAGTSAFDTPSCTGGSGNDVWYEFDATAGNTYTVTVNGDNYDGVLALYDGICFTSFAEEVGCSDNGLSNGIAETVSYTPEESGQVIIQTYDFFLNGGEFDISLDCEIVNDEPCDAIEIACGDTLENTTVGATQSSLGSPSCTGGSQNDVFYTFTAYPGVDYTTTVNGDNYDGVLAVYSGDCAGSLTELGCSDVLFNGNMETVDFSVDAESNILIQTYDWSSSSGEFTIILNGEVENDDPCDAIAIDCGETLSGTTHCAEATSGDVCYLGIGDNFNVFYQFESEANGVYEATLSGLEQLGSLTALTGNCGGSLSILECDFTFGTTETITFTSELAQTIYLRADHFTGYIDSFDISLECITPDNDLCADAEVLTVNDPGDCTGNEVEGTTIGATTDNISGVCETNNPDVFYSFNSGSYSNLNINMIAGTTTDLGISVLENSCSGNQIYCLFNNENNLISVEPNTNYLVRANTNISFGDPGTFTICVEGIYDCPSLNANIGDSCNDGDPNTSGDIVTADCNCEGDANSAPLNVSLSFNSSCAPRDVSVKLYQPGTTNLLHSYSTTVGASGSFSLPVALGTFDIFVKVEGYLQEGIGNITISAPSGNNVAFGSLDGGDINNDNVVNILDVSSVNAAFGSSIGDSNYSELADFNCDGSVNILDVSGLNANFGNSGMAAPLSSL